MPHQRDGSPGFDVAALARQLRRTLSGQVHDDPGTRALYASDASNYRVTPQLVVAPSDVAELAAAAQLIVDSGAPLVLRGGGTSMAGNAIGGVIVDTGRLTGIGLIDAETRRVRVEPGVVLSELNRAVARHGLTFGADPSSASRATLGGMIASNACGAHSVAWGTTADNVSALDIVLADGTPMRIEAPSESGPVPARMAELAARPGRDGELHRALQALAEREQTTLRRRFPDLRRRISGYALDALLPERGFDLTRLLCGSEGTLAVTTGAELRLTALPDATVLLVLGFPDPISAAASVPYLLPSGPLTVESINAELVDRLPESVRNAALAAGLPTGRMWLLVDVGGQDSTLARATAVAMLDAIRDAGLPGTGSVITDAAARAVLWRCRRDGTGLATRRADGREAWAGWEDAAVPPARLGEYLTELDELMARFGYAGASYGHFGEGCMHMRIDFDLLSAAGVAQYRDFVEQATDLVVRLGGSVSGEHGDGRARSALLAHMYGADVVDLFGEVKRIWDPRRALNPGVIADPAPLTQQLKLLRQPVGSFAGSGPRTAFDYPHDGGSFAVAQRRCVGVAKCRQADGGVMCPSFQVTHDERHSTRGRARLLWEMVQGETITDGWRSTEVRDALDLCLSCKGCLSDCPVNVDMATYKAEFFSHFYHRRLRPLSHYSMGWLPLWAWLASRAPRLVNALTRSPLAPLLKRLGGIAPQRTIPPFARRPFTRGHRPAAPTNRQQVVLWPDTFSNFLSPEVAHAAVRVLDAAGLEVIVPRQAVCCGLTWISTGQLATAKRVLGRTLDVLDEYLRRDLPVVALEPSCLAVFRHDGPALFPGDERADRLRRQSRSLAELLAEYAPDWTPPRVGGAALVQTHCHQHAVVGFEADTALMAAAGIRATVPDSGCCGLAGNFGFEAGHYEVSMAAAERVLLPAVRSADTDQHIVADGFSCRTQISAGTDRSARHLVQLLADALRAPDQE